MILQTNHLRVIENADHENKGLNLHDLQNAGVMVSLELVSAWGDTSLRLVDSVSV
jgi:hypothetical protein